MDEDTVNSRFPLLEGEYVYKGIRVGVILHNREHLESLPEKAIEPRDWFICTYPKSGTTWVQEILCQMQPKKPDEKHVKESVIFLARVPILEVILPPEQAAPVHEDAINVYKTHFQPPMLPKQLFTKKPKLVVVIRNPRDVAVSFYYYQMSVKYQEQWTKGWDEFLECFLAGCCPYGDWFKWVREWWKVKDNSHMLFLTYEWINKNHTEAVARICSFLGLALNEQDIGGIVDRTTLTAMRKDQLENSPMTRAVYDLDKNQFFRKGKAGDWKNHFTVAQSEMFEKRYQDELKGFDDLKQFIETGGCKGEELNGNNNI